MRWYTAFGNLEALALALALGLHFQEGLFESRKSVRKSGKKKSFSSHGFTGSALRGSRRLGYPEPQPL